MDKNVLIILCVYLTQADQILMKHYHVSEFPFSLKPVKNTTVFRLKVIELKGKRRKVSVK